jgi:hypothetical protein
MAPQNIVPATGLNEISGGGVLIGKLHFITGLRHVNTNLLTNSANSLIRTARNVKIYRVSAQLSTVIPTLAQTLGLSPNANISVDNVWTSLLPFMITRPVSGARALSKLWMKWKGEGLKNFVAW